MIFVPNFADICIDCFVINKFCEATADCKIYKAMLQSTCKTKNIKHFKYLNGIMFFNDAFLFSDCCKNC